MLFSSSCCLVGFVVIWLNFMPCQYAWVKHKVSFLLFCFVLIYFIVMYSCTDSKKTIKTHVATSYFIHAVKIPFRMLLALTFVCKFLCTETIPLHILCCTYFIEIKHIKHFIGNFGLLFFCLEGHLSCMWPRVLMSISNNHQGKTPERCSVMEMANVDL